MRHSRIAAYRWTPSGAAVCSSALGPLIYAEVKAIASGNPMVIEKARTVADRAPQPPPLRASRNPVQTAQPRAAPDRGVAALEKRLEDVHRDLTTRHDTNGDKSVMVLEGQEVRDRGIAGELLLRRAERMRGTQSDRLVGAIAGFQILVADNFMQGPEIGNRSQLCGLRG